MPVWQETHGPSGDAAGFHANHCCSRPSRYRAARSGLHPSPTETVELTAKARPTRKKRRRYMAAPSVLLTPRIGSVRNDFSRCNWRELPELRAPNRFSGLVELANTGFDTARARPLTALWFGCGRGRAVLHSRGIQVYAETQEEVTR